MALTLVKVGMLDYPTPIWTMKLNKKFLPSFCNFIPSFHNFTPSFINPPPFVLSLYTTQICKVKKCSCNFLEHTPHVKVEVYEKYVFLCTIHRIVHTPWQYLYGRLAPNWPSANRPMKGWVNCSCEGLGSKDTFTSLREEVYFCQIGT